MFSQDASFYGYNSGTQPTDIDDVIDYVNFFAISAGTGGVPNVVPVTIPQSTGGVDSEGNDIEQYNFTTIEIPSGTIIGDAYYTFLIPDESIGGIGSGNRQTVIEVSFGNGPNTFGTEATSATLYNYGTIVNPGGQFANGTYRLYSTNSIGSGLFYDNTSTTIYFKGGIVT